jgi:hypothetical protein
MSEFSLLPISQRLPEAMRQLDEKDAEIARLRAELAAVQAASKICRHEMVQDIIRLKVAARRDAEEIARLTDEKRLAEIAGWALCKHSEGGGPGKCDLMACACGPEGLAVAKAIRAALAPRPPEGMPHIERAPDAPA